jgi:hypothetical protein
MRTVVATRFGTPPPPPPPTRALVAWSDTVCTNTKSIDGLRTEIESVNENANDPEMADFAGSDAESYITQVSSDLDEATRGLKAIAPSGIKAADAYVAGLVSTLNGIRPKLPKQNDTTMTTLPDAQKVAKARQIAGVIATIKPQAPILAGMVNAHQRCTGHGLDRSQRQAGHPRRPERVLAPDVQR